jgi:hypothetical protein
MWISASIRCKWVRSGVYATLAQQITGGVSLRWHTWICITREYPRKSHSNIFYWRKPSSVASNFFDHPPRMVQWLIIYTTTIIYIYQVVEIEYIIYTSFNDEPCNSNFPSISIVFVFYIYFFYTVVWYFSPANDSLNML